MNATFVRRTRSLASPGVGHSEAGPPKFIVSFLFHAFFYNSNVWAHDQLYSVWSNTRKKQTSPESKPYICPKFLQKPNFIVILNACSWIPTQTVLHELEIFSNHHVTECRKNVPNAIYNAHGWLMKYKYIAAQYDEQERVCWMTFTIFALLS